MKVKGWTDDSLENTCLIRCLELMRSLIRLGMENIAATSIDQASQSSFDTRGFGSYGFCHILSVKSFLDKSISVVFNPMSFYVKTFNSKIRPFLKFSLRLTFDLKNCTFFVWNCSFLKEIFLYRIFFFVKVKSPSVWLSIWCNHDANFTTTRNSIMLNRCTRWNGAIRWTTDRSTRCRKKWRWIPCVIITFGESSTNFKMRTLSWTFLHIICIRLQQVTSSYPLKVFQIKSS